MARPVGGVRATGVGDVEQALVGREGKAVRAHEIIRHDG
jgi:hypothetical protein